MRLAATKIKAPARTSKTAQASPRFTPSSTPKSVTVSHAKTHLLTLVSAIDERGESLVLTRRGRPVAKLVPIDSAPAADIFGCMKGSATITGDIVGPEPDVWEAMS